MRKILIPHRRSCYKKQIIFLLNPLMNDRINQALELLQRSSFRSRFKLSAKDLSYIDSKGIETISRHASDFVTTRIAPRFPKNDGKQTPMKNHPVFIAQHATATCCRRCLQKWHGIDKGAPLEVGEVHFIVELIMAWIKQQTNMTH